MKEYKLKIGDILYSEIEKNCIIRREIVNIYGGWAITDFGERVRLYSIYGDFWNMDLSVIHWLSTPEWEDAYETFLLNKEFTIKILKSNFNGWSLEEILNLDTDLIMELLKKHNAQLQHPDNYLPIIDNIKKMKRDKNA